MKYLLVSCLLCASLELTPVLSQVNNNGNLEIENTKKELISVVTVPSCMDPERCILPTVPEQGIKEITLSVPEQDLKEVTSSIPTEDDSYFSYDEEILTEEEFFQIQEQNFIDRSIETDFDIKYNYDNYIYPLAKIIFAEAGNMNDEHQQYVGYVVMNRVNSIYYPNTIKEVFFEKGQYAKSSIERYNNECVTEQAIKNAEIVINEFFSDTMPVSPAMVYQAEFEQGVAYKKMGNTYFGCNAQILDDLNSENLDDDPELKKDTNK